MTLYYCCLQRSCLCRNVVTTELVTLQESAQTLGVCWMSTSGKNGLIWRTHTFFLPLGDPHTHLPRVLRRRAVLHTEMLLGGGWCWCWWDQPAYAPSDAPSIPLTHQLTSIYPYPPSHHSRFLRWRASFNNASDPKTVAEHSKNRRTADAVA